MKSKNQDHSAVTNSSEGINRRSFLATATVAGISSTLGISNVFAQKKDGVWVWKELPEILLPYLQNPTPEGMTICLPATSITAMKVYCKEKGNRNARSIEAKAKATKVKGSPWSVWKARVEDLKPGEEYEYVIQYTAKGEKVNMERLSFKTFDPNARESRCAVFNDIHDKIYTIEAVMDVIKDKEFDYSILNGDMINDPKSFAQSLAVWNEYVRILDGGTKPMIFIRGNHELRGRGRNDIAAIFDLPHLDMKDDPDDYRYECQWQTGPIHFISTDTGEDDRPSTPEDNYRRPKVMNKMRERQVSWLKDIEKKQPKKTPWRIFVSHIPLFNTAPHVCIPAQKMWLPILEKMDIDLSLAGHDHGWKSLEKGQKYEAKRDDKVLKEEVLFDTIIGGGPSREKGTIIFVHATDKKLTTEMYQSTGKKLDRTVQTI